MDVGEFDWFSVARTILDYKSTVERNVIYEMLTYKLRPTQIEGIELWIIR